MLNNHFAVHCKEGEKVMNRYVIAFFNANGEKRSVEVDAASEDEAKAFVHAFFVGSHVYRIEL